MWPNPTKLSGDKTQIFQKIILKNSHKSAQYCTAWNPYLPAFWLYTDQKNSVCRHFSSSVAFKYTYRENIRIYPRKYEDWDKFWKFPSKVSSIKLTSLDFYEYSICFIVKIFEIFLNFFWGYLRTTNFHDKRYVWLFLLLFLVWLSQIWPPLR